MNYLDVTLDLRTENFHPYRKPDNTPTFIHAYSKHPPAIFKEIPKSVGQRVSIRSSSKDEFDKAAPLYNLALKASGFKESAPFVEIDNKKERKTAREIDIETLSGLTPPPPHIARMSKKMSESDS